ncbi:hypothetical protein [Bacillus cihuensis]|uniref:hypothetical protein n=1 Tax=Bacillus cihuensis TaxID=1208599 RepID=UPI000410E691|nr:hypothetical protein [Bacillus cihuensis]
MNIENILIIIVIGLGALIVLGLIIFLVYLYIFDRNQKAHSILRNYPALGRMRYFLEKIGPEFRQYWFNSDTEGKPFSRDEYEHIVKSAK